MLYETKFINRRDSKVVVRFQNEKDNFLIPAHKQTIRSTTEQYALYAPFKKVEYLKNNAIKFTEREDWKEPNRGRWVVTFINVDGADIETVFLDGGCVPINIPKGVPVKIGVPVGSFYARFSEYRFEVGQVLDRRKVEHCGIERNPEELRAIEEERKKEELKRQEMIERKRRRR